MTALGNNEYQSDLIQALGSAQDLINSQTTELEHARYTIAQQQDRIAQMVKDAHEPVVGASVDTCACSGDGGRCGSGGDTVIIKEPGGGSLRDKLASVDNIPDDELCRALISLLATLSIFVRQSHAEDEKGAEQLEAYLELVKRIRKVAGLVDTRERGLVRELANAQRWQDQFAEGCKDLRKKFWALSEAIQDLEDDEPTLRIGRVRDLAEFKALADLAQE